MGGRRYTKRARFGRSVGVKRHGGFSRYKRYGRRITRRRTSKKYSLKKRRHLVKRARPAPKTSKAFKDKVRSAVIEPYRFSRTSGNVEITSQTTHPTASYFQPHSIATIGTPPIAPTAKTQYPIHLLDYPSTSAMIINVLPGLGTAANSMHQRVVISGVMKHVVRNHTNEPIKYHAWIWEVSKMNNPPLDQMRIPNSVTTPVYTGNWLNLLGNALFNQGVGGVNDALNTAMHQAEIDATTLPMVRRYFKAKKVAFTLHPGLTKTFTIGVKRVVIDTQECFSYESGAGLTDPTTWDRPFIPGAKGILFRQFCEAGVKNASAHTAENDTVTFNPCESSVTTSTKYWVYHKPQAYDSTIWNNTLLGDTGIELGATDFMNEEKDEEVAGAIA